MNRADWEREFARQLYPEWQQRQSMTLEEFKSSTPGSTGIGCLVGLLVLHLAYRWPTLVKRSFNTMVEAKSFRLLGLGGAQGLIGWWMVRSGLNTDHYRTAKQMRVSSID